MDDRPIERDQPHVVLVLGLEVAALRHVLARQAPSLRAVVEQRERVDADRVSGGDADRRSFRREGVGGRACQGVGLGLDGHGTKTIIPPKHEPQTERRSVEAEPERLLGRGLLGILDIQRPKSPTAPCSPDLLVAPDDERPAEAGLCLSSATA